MANTLIEWELLGYAVEFYRRRGYEYIELDWFIDQQFCLATHPSKSFEIAHEGELTGKQLVASAEQSFLALSDLPKGRYVGCTPCFRNEEPDPTGLHQQSFMKVELFDTTTNGYVELLADAKNLFSELLNFDGNIGLRSMLTPEGHDIMLNDIEIGSYGTRGTVINGRYVYWSYGTGLALPRFTQASSIKNVS